MAVKVPTHVKRFIVQLNAQGDTPGEVASAVLAEFSLEVSRALVQHYDPSRIQGKDLSKPLRALFYETRKAFIESADTLPMAQKAIRLQRLEAIHERAAEAGNLKSATQAIEAARREMVALAEEGGSSKVTVFNVVNAVEAINSPVPE